MPDKESSLQQNNGSFSWKKRGQSFGYAWKGIRHVFKTQHNMWIHGVAAVLAIGLGIVLHISTVQWFIILLCIALVLSLEMMNTAIEVLADHLHPGQHPKIGWVKDMAAGAVLVAATVSLILGCWIFCPAIMAFFK